MTGCWHSAVTPVNLLGVGSHPGVHKQLEKQLGVGMCGAWGYAVTWCDLVPPFPRGIWRFIPNHKDCLTHRPHFPQAELGGSHVFLLRNASQRAPLAISVSIRGALEVAIQNAWVRPPHELSFHWGAATQPSVLLNSSRMRGVAKGCESWMRSSCCVCCALMLRSSVRTAMIFRKRNL